MIIEHDRDLDRSWRWSSSQISVRRSRISPRGMQSMHKRLMQFPQAKGMLQGMAVQAEEIQKFVIFLCQLPKSSTWGGKLPPCYSRPLVRRLLQPLGAPAAMLDDSMFFHSRSTSSASGRGPRLIGHFCYYLL